MLLCRLLLHLLLWLLFLFSRPCYCCTVVLVFVFASLLGCRFICLYNIYSCCAIVMVCCLAVRCGAVLWNGSPRLSLYPPCFSHSPSPLPPASHMHIFIIQHIHSHTDTDTNTYLRAYTNISAHSVHMDLYVRLIDRFSNVMI